MKVMLCSESSVQHALAQVQRQVHVAKIVLQGGGSAAQLLWYDKFARDCVVYLMCFGFVAVKLVKLLDDDEQIVPVVVPLSQIEWEYNTDPDAIFVCPRVRYKDVSSARRQTQTTARPRIYVYGMQCVTVDLCNLGPMCCVLDSYRQLVAARNYNTRCNADNLKHVAYIESRVRDVEKPEKTSVDMTSVLQHTMRALPRDTSDKTSLQDHESYEVLRKRNMIQQQLVFDEGCSAQTSACVLPIDTTARNITQRIPQIDLLSYTCTFERGVYLAMGVGDSNPGGGSKGSTRDSHRSDEEPRRAGHDPAEPLTVLVAELENILGLFASAVNDPKLVNKIQRFEAAAQKRAATCKPQKRKRGINSSRAQRNSESIDIQALGVARSVKCTIRPHIVNDTQLALQLYQESFITPQSFGAFLEQTTGFKFTGLPPGQLGSAAADKKSADDKKTTDSKNAIEHKKYADAQKAAGDKKATDDRKAEEAQKATDTGLALQLYQESLITPQSFGSFLEDTTGFKFTGLPAGQTDSAMSVETNKAGPDKQKVEEQKRNEEERKKKEQERKKKEEERKRNEEERKQKEAEQQRKEEEQQRKEEEQKRKEEEQKRKEKQRKNKEDELKKKDEADRKK